ncbi:MAG: hypothetical protein HY860_05270 [Chlamydiales bacterium]|nr:hypothetical protein [Chlamydiales bacterium]
MNQETAPESLKTMKARKKLEQRMKTLEKKVTQQALRRKVHEMKVWISKYAMERTTLKDDDIVPLTKTTAKIASKIQDIFTEMGKHSNE